MAAPVSVRPDPTGRRAVLVPAGPPVGPSGGRPKYHTIAGSLLLLYLAGVALTDRIVARVGIPGSADLPGRDRPRVSA